MVLSKFGEAEKVLVELDWFDGPRAGIANIEGAPHRFRSYFNDEKDDWDDFFKVWPIGERELELELEQWRIFVEWWKHFDAGVSTTAEHPAHGGIHKRWDEIEKELKGGSRIIPISARTAYAKFEYRRGEKQYQFDGPNYSVRWLLFEQAQETAV